MVNNDKRQRHKAGHRSRVEAARLAEAQRRRRRRLILAGIAVVAIVGVFVAVTVTSGDDGEKRGLDHHDHATTSTPAVTAPPPGEAVDGETPCPPADGSAARTTAFTEPPPTCIDEAKTYTAEVADLRGRHHRSTSTRRTHPITVNNFVVLSRYHYFDGLPFHRIVPGFVDQTGSSGVPDIPNGGPGYDLPDEPPTREYAAGDVAMAQGGGTNSGQPVLLHDRPGQPAGRHVPDHRQGERGPGRRAGDQRRSASADEAADEVGHHRLGDDHRVLTSRATAARSRSAGSPPRNTVTCGDAVGAPRAVRVAEQRGALRDADERQVGRAELAGAVDRRPPTRGRTRG